MNKYACNHVFNFTVHVSVCNKNILVIAGIVCKKVKFTTSARASLFFFSTFFQNRLMMCLSS